MNVKELLGKEVLDVHGDKIGKVADLDVDMLHAVINHVILKSGLTKKYNIKVDEIVTIGDKVILRTGADELRKRVE
ncbi:MAG TPA: hypothetical protein G4O12_04215 [Dehalococcoidia bacterium]|nr:hypothetical protein [Dehalococcoidia bacterium]